MRRMITDKELQALSGGMPYVKARITMAEDRSFTFPTIYVGNCIYVKAYPGDATDVYEEFILGFGWDYHYQQPKLTMTLLHNEEYPAFERYIESYDFNAEGTYSHLTFVDDLNFRTLEVVYQNYRGIQTGL